MKKIFFGVGSMLLLTCVSGLVGQANAQSVSTYVEANYQSLVDPNSNGGSLIEFVQGVAGGSQINSSLRTFVNPFNVGAEPEPFGFSIEGVDARARSSLRGTMGAYAAAGGASSVGGSPTNLHASASAYQTTRWIVSGDDGGNSAIDLSIALDGFLQEYAFGDSATYSSVEAKVELVADDSFIEVWAESATLDPSGNLTFDGSFSNDWMDSFTSIGGNFSGETVYSQLYEEDVFSAFMVDNNTEFEIVSSLTVTAEVAGPFEITALADYFNTSSLSLSTTTPGSSLGSLNPVPEPSGLCFAAGLGLLTLVRRRKTAV